jgi:hypothetical protein
MIRLQRAAIVMAVLLFALPITRLAAQGSQTSSNDIVKSSSGAELERSAFSRRTGLEQSVSPRRRRSRPVHSHSCNRSLPERHGQLTPRQVSP